MHVNNKKGTIIRVLFIVYLVSSWQDSEALTDVIYNKVKLNAPYSLIIL